MNFFKYILRRSRIFILLTVILPIVAGSYAYQTIPKEGEPEIQAPIAIITTLYHGASPGEIESLVTNPIEDELSDLRDVEEIRSSSSEGVSVIVVEFDVDADRERSLSKVREKVTDARGELPEDAEDPVVDEISLSDIPIMLVSVVGDLDPLRLRRLAEDAADELELLPEVLSTEVAGGLTREIQIYLDPDRLNQFGLTILDVYNAVKQSDVNIPGGMVNLPERRVLLRVMTEVKKVEDYGLIPLVRQGDRVVYLGDVAEVRDGHEEDLTYSRVDGVSSVSIAVKKRTGANILETTRKVREKLTELEKEFPAGVKTVITAEQAKYIGQTFEIMNNSALTGLVIVVFVLYFAMGLRNSIITSLSIPLSILLTFVLLKVFGITNNNMVRFSLVLCIGLLVDNAIIVVENAYHHYQQGKDRLTAAISGVSEIALPVISATLTTMAAFLPLLLMTGTTGEYMGFMPKTVTIALTSSLIVALIASPLVLSRFMKQTLKKGRVVRPEEDLVRLKWMYVHAVTWALNHRLAVLVLGLAALVWAGGLVSLGVIKVEMFPDVDFDYIYITIETPPGTEVEQTDSVARRVEEIVKKLVPEAVQVVSTVGTRPQSALEITVGQGLMSNYAEVTVELLEGQEFSRPGHMEIQRRIRPDLEAIAGASIRFRPLAWGPPKFAPVVVKVMGPDLNILREITARVKQTLSGIKGAVDVKDDFSGAPPELRVEVDREAAARLGVPLNSVALGLRGATAGLDIRDYRDEVDLKKKYDLLVRFNPGSRTSASLLTKVKIRSASGSLVPLSNVAAFKQGPGINAIRHVDRRRVVRATAQNEGRSAVEITKELKEKLAAMEMPRGYAFNFEGDYKDTEESFSSLKLAYMIAFLLIFALLVAQFNSYYQPFAIMTALPLSVVGAMFGLMVTNNNFSIFSFVGLVGLTGIVVNDSIVLVDCINRVREEGSGIFEAIVTAGQLRLRPILSTTITTIGGIITLTITDELWEGLGVVIIFGIAFATALTLVVVPVMYSLFESLGSYVNSALFGPGWKDVPQGRGFFFTRRKNAWGIIVVLGLVQIGVLAAAGQALLPVLAGVMDQTVLRAPTWLKLGIEVFVFALEIILILAGALVVLLLPAWLGLLVLMGRRSRETCFVDVRPEGVMVVLPTEKTFFYPGEIDGIKYSPLQGRLTIRAKSRLISIKDVIEAQRTPQKIPLKTWLAAPAPTGRERRQGTKALRQALEQLMRNRPAGG